MNYLMAICDSEIEYSYQLVNYIEQKRGFPFQVQLFTSVDNLIEYSEKKPVFLALISETDYVTELENLGIDHILLIGEKEKEFRDKKVLNKYQSCDRLIKELLQWIADYKILPKITNNGTGLKLIGIYSPAGKSLKTSFAFVLGQLLAKRNKVLYLNMESYSGLGQLLERDFSTDMSELIYYLQNSKESFGCRMGGMIEQIGDLDVLPPFDSYLDFISVTKEEWIRLFKEIEQNSEYEYLIVDLSDAVQGLFDILRLCDVVYTLSREDGFAKAKVKQYEELLKKSNYEDIWMKTKYCKIPKIQNLPAGLLQLTYTELAEFVRMQMKEDFDEE